MYVAVSGGDIIFQDINRELLEQMINEICTALPELFYREYITVIPREEYMEYFGGRS